MIGKLGTGPWLRGISNKWGTAGCVSERRGQNSRSFSVQVFILNGVAYYTNERSLKRDKGTETRDYVVCLVFILMVNWL